MRPAMPETPGKNVAFQRTSDRGGVEQGRLYPRRPKFCIPPIGGLNSGHLRPKTFLTPSKTRALVECAVHQGAFPNRHKQNGPQAGRTDEAVMARMKQLLFAASAIALLSGCSGGGGGTSSSSSQPVSSPPPPPPPPPPSPPPPPAVPTATPTSQTDVVYGTGLLKTGSKSLTLDVYQSGDPCTEARPFVMLVHGGGFDPGTKSDAPWPAIAQDLTGHDYTVLSIDYRQASDAPEPSAEFYPLRDAILASGETGIAGSDAASQADSLASAIEDGVTALRWAEDHHDELCVDVSRFAIWGESEGAIIALQLAYGLDAHAIYSPEPDVLVDYWGRFIHGGEIAGGDAPPADPAWRSGPGHQL